MIQPTTVNINWNNEINKWYKQGVNKGYKQGINLGLEQPEKLITKNKINIENGKTKYGKVKTIVQHLISNSIGLYIIHSAPPRTL